LAGEKMLLRTSSRWSPDSVGLKGVTLNQGCQIRDKSSRIQSALKSPKIAKNDKRAIFSKWSVKNGV